MFDFDEVVDKIPVLDIPEEFISAEYYELEKAISLTFAGQEYTGREIMTKEKYILRNVVQSFANQLYVKRVYLKK